MKARIAPRLFLFRGNALRLGAQRAHQIEGHGLGLAIVQRVVQAHGGEIEARNAQDGGLEVIIRLPMDLEKPSSL